MSRRQKRNAVRIITAAVLLAAVFAADKLLMAQASMWLKLAAYLIPYIIVGGDVLARAIRNIGRAQFFDENFLMAIATVGALSIGFLPEGEAQFSEAVFVMLFYQTGELFQSIAVGKSRRSIAALMDIRPDTADVERENGVEQVEPEAVQIGEIIVVRPGEKIALDGEVIEGFSSLNTVALTGESAPRDVGVGDSVVSGCINMSGVLRIKVSKTAGESTVSKILELVENSSANKAHSERFITRFARWYTPLVVVAAVLLACIPPLVFGEPFSEWLFKALTFLIVSCPCALVISVPLSFFGGIGGASRKGILIKGSNYLEALARTEIAVFDKTGTLTKGKLEVVEINPVEFEPQELLRLAAAVESYSNHPLAQSLCRACPNAAAPGRAVLKEERAGKGISATVDGRQVYVGNLRLMREIRVDAVEPTCVSTAVYVAVDGKFAGSIVVADTVKETAKQAIDELKVLGIRQTVMLSGDNDKVAKQLAQSLGIDEYCANLLPGEKVAQVERLFGSKTSAGKLMYVGDGINDAPVIARADIGVAMGALGADAAIEAADVVLMDDDMNKLAVAIKLARRTVRIVKQNIAFALSVKAAILVLASFGMTGLLTAVFADVGVAVIAILNAMRTLKQN